MHNNMKIFISMQLYVYTTQSVSVYQYECMQLYKVHFEQLLRIQQNLLENMDLDGSIFTSYNFVFYFIQVIMGPLQYKRDKIRKFINQTRNHFELFLILNCLQIYTVYVQLCPYKKKRLFQDVIFYFSPWIFMHAPLYHFLHQSGAHSSSPQ